MRRSLVAWVSATDALPILSSLIGALSRDNGPELMYLYMWLFWAWIVTVPPRLAFYAFNFVTLRRTGYVAACAFVLVALWGICYAIFIAALASLVFSRKDIK